MDRGIIDHGNIGFESFQRNLCDLFNTAQKVKFSIKDLSSECEKIRSFLRIWSHLLKKSLTKIFTFCTLYVADCQVLPTFSWDFSKVSQQLLFLILGNNILYKRLQLNYINLIKRNLNEFLSGMVFYNKRNPGEI